MKYNKQLKYQIKKLPNIFWRNVCKYSLFYCALILTMVLYRLCVSEPSKVKVSVEFKAGQKDVFQFFYRILGDPDFSEKNSIKSLVNGKEDFQQLSFEMPIGCRITNIRLDLGSNPQQQEVEIKSILLVYKSDTLVAFSGDHKNRFMANENVERSGNLFKLKLSKKGAYDPYLSSGEILVDYGNFTVDQCKLPAFLLIPILAAILIHLIFFLKHRAFLPSFYAFAACFFMGMLLLPVLNMEFDLYSDENREKRALAEKPIFTVKGLWDFPGKFENYFNDNFGFRSLLVSISGKIKYYLFDASAAPVVSVGKNGWTYITGPFKQITGDSREGNVLPDSIVQSLVEQWEARKDSLNKCDIHYYKAFWPEKHSIYPEFLSWQMKAAIKDTLLRLDQVLNYLKKKNSPLHIVDVTELLQERKKKAQVYLKYDSHWNASGAFVGYTELMKQISLDFPQLRPHPLSDFDVHYELKKGGDMIDMLYVDAEERIPVYKLKGDSSQARELPFVDYPLNSKIFENKSASTNLYILINRDSYTEELIQFLKPHFRKMVLLWNNPFSYEFVAKERPDIVVESNVSRFIGKQSGF